MLLSDKQKEFIRESGNHRWAIKYGATRSGKTYLDYFAIPMRIRERHGKDGLYALLGNTKGTLQRNIIEPMQSIYGTANVSSIKSDNTSMIFGERVHCLGADNIKHVDRLRGTSIKYAYGDEIVTWNEDVFEMLKSRLDHSYSHFDGTCNPADPEHWVKKFIDSDADIFKQQYTLDDNPFLDSIVVEELKKEHKGVFYERYILGEWCVAEGLVFPYFAEDSTPYITTNTNYNYSKITIGIDFGGTGSMTTFTATGYVNGYDTLIVLDEDNLPIREQIDSNMICDKFVKFYKRILNEYGNVNFIFCDSASPTMINSLISASREAKLPTYNKIVGCRKNAVKDRPVTIDRLLNSGRLYINQKCKGVIKALASLRWDNKNTDIPEDENKGNINDIYDSFCYSWIDFVEYIDRHKKY